jgi:hypothetical protein
MHRMRTHRKSKPESTNPVVKCSQTKSAKESDVIIKMATTSDLSNNLFMVPSNFP